MFKNNKIELTKDQLCRVIYFILMKFRGDPLHMQGTSVKRDFVGGYIERWFNKVAETIIFNKILEGKNYSVVGDFFVYGSDSEKNAPDVLGLELSSGMNLPFVKYNNGVWTRVPEMPRIEVKVVRKDQMLLGVREPQMIDDYYVFIESDLEFDYLTTVFEDEVFNDKYFKDLSMSGDFVAEDKDNQIIPHQKMRKQNNIGSIRLIGIYTKEELRRNSVLCTKGVSPYYFSDASNVSKVYRRDKDGVLKIDKDGKVEYENKIEESVYLPFSVKGTGESLPVLKRNKGSVYVKSDSPLEVDGIEVFPGLVKIEFKRFQRSSNWDENISSKYMLDEYGKDSTEELIKRFDEIVSKLN